MHQIEFDDVLCQGQSLLKRFNHVPINDIPGLENQEANDLAQIASGYKISKEGSDELVEVRDKIISVEIPLEVLSISRLGGKPKPRLQQMTQKNMKF